MKFTTIVPIKEAKRKLTYEDKVLSMGSCFAVNMSEKFKAFQFQHTVNPFGILFHPLAIERVFRYAVEGYVFTEKDVFEHNEVWSCLAAHSDLNELEEEDIVTKLNVKLFDLQVALKEASHLVLTFGTAWVYEHIETQQLVANCHKLPQQLFRKRLLSYEEVLESYHRIVKLIQEVNPTVQVVFTISPVRHIKDGVVENQRSKSLLIAALHQMLEEVNNSDLRYFPAYEVMMDELRDYRFYTADLLHPNDIAIDYIWERFVQTSISEEMYPIMKKVDEVQKGLAHRPFNPTASQHMQFLDNLVGKIDFLLDKYPFMNFR